MYLSRVTITNEGWKAIGRSQGEGLYAIHQLLWDIFPENKEANRDFLFNFDDDQTLLVLSERQPRTTDTMKVQTKAFDPDLKKGQYVRFRTTVNPVVRVGPSNKKAGIVQNARVQAMKEGVSQENMPSRQELMAQEAPKWFKKREAPCGFEVEDFQVELYEVRKFRKKPNSSPITLAIMEAVGVLKITDVGLFKKALKEGIGPSRAFGCGLLLIRPL